MATHLENAAFKVKTGQSLNVQGLRPEKGAIMFCNVDNNLKYADGFNWRPIAAGDNFASFASILGTPTVEAYTANVEVVPVTWYDAILYKVLTTITPTLGSTVTWTADMTCTFNAEYGISCDTPNVLFTRTVYFNGTPVEVEDHLLKSKDVQHLVYEIHEFPVTNGDVLTVGFKVNKSCNFTIHKMDVGFRQTS